MFFGKIKTNTMTKVFEVNVLMRELINAYERRSHANNKIYKHTHTHTIDTRVWNRSDGIFSISLCHERKKTKNKRKTKKRKKKQNKINMDNKRKRYYIPALS